MTVLPSGLLTYRDIAAMERVHVKTVQRWASKRNGLRVIRYSKKCHRIRPAELEKFRARNEEAA